MSRNDGMTRVVRISPDGMRSREDAENLGTRVRGPAHIHVSAQDALEFGRGAFRKAFAEHKAPGLVAVSIDSSGIVESGWVSAEKGPRALSIGRHSQCDLHIPNESVSLRHLAAMVLPANGRVVARVMDLSTPDAFRMEDGTAARTIVFDQVAILQIPGHWLFFAITGHGSPFAVGVEDEWAALPRRELLDQTAAARPGAPVPPVRRNDERVTSVSRVHAPVGAPADLALAPGEVAVGTLRVRGPHGTVQLPLSERAVQQGVVIGRYERCIGPDIFRDDEDATVSRVHALLVRAGDDIVLLDTGSTLGLLGEGGRKVHAVVMHAGCIVQLGDADSVVEWTPALEAMPRAKGVQ